MKEALIKVVDSRCYADSATTVLNLILFNLCLARPFCSTCATSVSSESVFSIAGYINRKEKNSLKPKNLRYTILSRQNEKLIYVKL